MYVEFKQGVYIHLKCCLCNKDLISKQTVVKDDMIHLKVEKCNCEPIEIKINLPSGIRI